MGYLSEVEIIDKLCDSLRIAAQACDDIAIRPRKGRTYSNLRDALAEAEGACRQMGHWRGHYAWFKVGMELAEAHKRAGGWLRGVPDTVTLEDGSKRNIHRHLRPGEKHPLFVKLGENLRFFLKKALELQNAPTGKLGAVLPEVPNLGRRVGAPVAVSLPAGMHRLGSGLIVPDGVTAQ